MATATARVATRRLQRRAMKRPIKRVAVVGGTLLLQQLNFKLFKGFRI